MGAIESLESLPLSYLADLLLELSEREALGDAPLPLARQELERIAVSGANAERDLPVAELPLSQPIAAWIHAWFSEHGDAQFHGLPGPIPPFDLYKGFWKNFFEGPRNGVPLLVPDVQTEPTDFLGFELNFPFGVPACALTPQAHYIKYFAQRGFDLLTYKTVRDQVWNPHQFPQWGFATNITTPIDASARGDSVVGSLLPGSLDPEEISLVNSFGVPSLPIDRWQDDVRLAQSFLSNGQVLIVSIMGSPDSTDDDEVMIAQFVTAAVAAARAEAKIIEVNLSCPNTGGTGVLCEDSDKSGRVVRAIFDGLRAPGVDAGHVKVLIKISYLETEALAGLLTECADVIDGVVAINTVAVPTFTRRGLNFFPNRPNNSDRSGLSGVGIRDLGLEITRRLSAFRRDGLFAGVIVGVGGVTSPEDYASYLKEGANAVQSCSGAWMNPRLAISIREKYGDGRYPSRLANKLSRVGELIASGGFSALDRDD
jgi:dihydroorotate dehydrogenase (NAD+) catalytic subunit